MNGIEHLLQLPAPLVLASGSPRRKELLTTLGLRFTVVVTNVDESVVPTHIPPAEYVQQLAVLKAQHGAAAIQTECIVIGTDTTVVIDGMVLNKPANTAEAFEMLSMLSARTHTVHTGVALVYQGRVTSSSKATDVTFRELLPEEIEAYIATGSPMDKAGAYGIQDDFGGSICRAYQWRLF